MSHSCWQRGILDQDKGGTLCAPGRIIQNAVHLGVASEVDLTGADADNKMAWMTIQEKGYEAIVSSGRLLHYFVTDLQLHLGTWYDEYGSPRHYAKLGPMLRHRHAREKNSD